MTDEALAEEIIKRLFTNGAGQKARRLVLELDDGREGGGWCATAARDQIVEALRRSRPKPFVGNFRRKLMHTE